MTEHYFDNAATSCPKPGSIEHSQTFSRRYCANINRGSYASAYSAADTVLETRELLCTLFGFPKPLMWSLPKILR